MQASKLLTDLLSRVSRSFYLTLRALPRSIRPQIGLAYLLARTTDTIADTDIVPLDDRLASLQALRGRIAGKGEGRLEFAELARHQASAAEQLLLENIELSLSLLNALEPADIALVRQVLDTITGGQEMDLRRFNLASPQNVTALRTGEELDDYAYRVAGCVGEFWTRMCCAHVFRRGEVDETRLIADGIRFGKGLQLVNILRDLPSDLRQGRCYLPSEHLEECGIAPADLLQPKTERKMRSVYDRHLAAARSHLEAGWSYTNNLPRRCIRLRLACAWPVLIGLETTSLLQKRPVLDPDYRIKVTRQQVRRILWRTVVFYPWRDAWRGLGTFK